MSFPTRGGTSIDSYFLVVIFIIGPLLYDSCLPEFLEKKGAGNRNDFGLPFRSISYCENSLPCEEGAQRNFGQLDHLPSPKGLRRGWDTLEKHQDFA